MVRTTASRIVMLRNWPTTSTESSWSPTPEVLRGERERNTDLVIEAVTHTDVSLESVLHAVGGGAPEAAVLIGGDLRTVQRAGRVARRFDVPVLWWCDGPPAEEIQRHTVDLVDVVLVPTDETGVGRILAVGSGIDTQALRLVPHPPTAAAADPRVGRMPYQDGLAVPFRALAEARARGVNARLLLVGTARSSAPNERRDLEALVAELTLTQSVDLFDVEGVGRLPELLERVHAVIDAGIGPELDHVVLEAMACGRARPLVACSRSLGR